MARQARLFIPECPMVLELQGIAGQDVFKTREAFSLFHAQLPQSASEEDVAIHAYCLVPSGALLMISTAQAAQAGRFVQNLNRHFSPAFLFSFLFDVASNSTALLQQPLSVF